jgi:hypothetical protein
LGQHAPEEWISQRRPGCGRGEILFDQHALGLGAKHHASGARKTLAPFETLLPKNMSSRLSPKAGHSTFIAGWRWSRDGDDR